MAMFQLKINRINFCQYNDFCISVKNCMILDCSLENVFIFVNIMTFPYNTLIFAQIMFVYKENL